jgi:radical SAM superfamily enzyme YgiQ (UPF0313 family)
MKPARVFLADLTHNGLILSSNVFPLSIGLIAAYLTTRRPGKAQVELFKYPQTLAAAIEAQPPDIVGFANYSWNLNISYGFARIIKSIWPNTVVVFGGPNYGVTAEEVQNFWRTYEHIDFHIVGEGEEAFAQLVDSLIEVNFDFTAIKNERRRLANCHYTVGSEVINGPTLPRLSLDEVPSPYLMGLLDKFFDENLAPMIHTTRGCPFKCTFCTEGAAYYNAVEHREQGLRDELDYIGSRVRGPQDLFITDANFGMYAQDVAKAALIAECQEKYAYPKYLHVSTGKNKKERVIEIAAMLNGALNLAASLQSTDPTVLANVSRSNISVEKLAQVGLEANKADTGTYTELILGLPGDSLAAHQKSLRDVVEANFDNIRMYQLIMLPQTELNTPDTRRKFGMKTMHRIMPRSFGCYRLADRTFVSVESEEILVENSTLPFDDYIVCREMDLTIEIVHNGKVYKELQGICKSQGLSWFEFIMRFFSKRRDYTAEIRFLYDEFKASHSARLWPSRGELEAWASENFDAFIKDDKGTNEMSIGKATAFFELFDQINDILYRELADWLTELQRLDETMWDYLVECREFSRLRKANLLQSDAEHAATFAFDMALMETMHFNVLPQSARLPQPRRFRIAHQPEQVERLVAYRKEFGESRDGLGKMLMRYPHIHRLFRGVAATD